MEHDHEERPSKTRRKQAMLELQALGERLVALPPAVLERLDLPTALFDAVVEAQRITARGGRKRQIQYIGRLMREIDDEPVRASLTALDGKDASAKAAFHAAEAWRTRLLDEGDTALTEFLDRCPDADRQHLRRLKRDAVIERDGGRPPRHQRELFRYLRSLLQ